MFRERPPTTVRGALLSLTTILGFILSVDGARGEAWISFFPAIRIAELEAGGSARGDGYVDAEFTTSAGVRVPIRRASKPILTIQRSQVVSAIVQETPTLFHGRVEVIATVRLRLDGAAEARFRELHDRQPDDWVLVELAGRAVDLAPIEKRSEAGLPGGVFGSVEEAVASYRPLQVELRVERTSPELVSKYEQYAVDLGIAARWYEKCEPETYEELRSGGIDGLIDPNQAAPAADCSQPRPQFPPQHPTLAEACVEAGSEGETREGRRVGLWSVRNPYGETIRLDHFRDGVLERSVWMRSCPQE